MLPGLGRAQSELVVHRVRQDDADHVHIGIIRDAVEIFVSIDIAFLEPVFLTPLHALFRGAGDDSGETGMGCFLKCRGDLVFAQRSQANQRPTDLSPYGLFFLGACEGGSKASSDGGF